MKNLILTLFCCILVIYSNAQTENSFFGKWEYTTIEGYEEMDSMGQSMIESFFGGTTYFLQENGKFRVTSPMKNYEGDWYYNSVENQLNFLSYTGFGEIVKTPSITDKELVLQLDDMKMYFQRISSTEDEEIKDIQLEDALINVETLQIAKKWYRLYSTKPNQTKLQKELSKITLKDNYYKFDLSGKGIYKVFGDENDLEWSLNIDKNILFLTFEGNEMWIWYIVKCSKKELVLLKGNTGEKWYFSTKEPKLKDN